MCNYLLVIVLFQINTVNDCRPSLLTSVIKNCFESFIMSPLKEEDRPAVDSHHFAYKHKRDMDNAISTLAHQLEQLEAFLSYATLIW